MATNHALENQEFTGYHFYHHLLFWGGGQKTDSQFIDYPDGLPLKILF